MLYQNGIRRGWLYPVDFDEEEWDSVLTNVSSYSFQQVIRLNPLSISSIIYNKLK